MIERIRKASSSDILRGLLCALTAAFYIGAIFSPDLPEIFTGFWKIITNPAVLTKDYFFSEIGSVSGTMLNFALTGTFFCALMFLPGASITGVTLAAYGLSVGFCSYGINFLNIMPFQVGILLYSKIKKMPFVKNLNLAMFSCALGPLVSEVLFRYPGTEIHGFTLLGVVLALAIGIVTGMTMPALCAFMPNTHKGYNLYNAGPAAGFLCFTLFNILYKVKAFDGAAAVAPAVAGTLGEGSPIFVNIFCIAVFVLILIAGYIINGNSFKGYGALVKDSGHKVDFAAKYGIGPCVINVGVYGLFILAYYNIVGAKFTGPTFGAIWNMLAFAAAGSTPLNVFPLMIGYYVASLIGVNPINAQAIVVGMCFCSGLAPVTGRYGVVAGFFGAILHYFLVTSVPAIHGGFTVYNGGFTAGLVCLVLVPVLEAYFKTKDERKPAK